MIYLQDWDNLPKGGLIPDKTTSRTQDVVKDGDRKAYHLKMSPRLIS